MRRAIALTVTVVLLTAAQSPSPTPEPVFELHRTSSTEHLDVQAANPLFVLVIGSDIREGNPATGRADSIHIVALDTMNLRGTVLGIPRDAFVEIPGRGRGKINAALVYGGPRLLVETVSRLAQIPIHYYALTEFSRFRSLVDRLGGVTVDVPYPMADRFSGAFFDPGPRHMDGTEALAFARNRKSVPGGDFGRSENQGRLLIAGLAKLRAEATGPTALLGWLEAFASLIDTDVPIGDLIHLGMLGRRIDPANIANIVLPASGSGAGSTVLLGQPAQDVFTAIRDDGVL